MRVSPVDPSAASAGARWRCDGPRCEVETGLDAYGRPDQDGWWSCRGVHLCPRHYPGGARS